MTHLIVSVHDVSPATSREVEWWVGNLDRLGIRATLLLIPGPWRRQEMLTDNPFTEVVRSWADRGHEVSLHGWTHTQTKGGRGSRVMARGAAEFSGLTRHDAEVRLTYALERLDSFGLAPTGFTPPGWLLSGASRDAVAGLGIGYLTTHLAVHDLKRDQTRHVPVVCHRPGSALAGIGKAILTSAWIAARGTGKDLRLAIHPDDTHIPRLRQATLDVLQSAVASGVKVMSYADYLEAA